jgi:hypothetical protein
MNCDAHYVDTHPNNSMMDFSMQTALTTHNVNQAISDFDCMDANLFPWTSAQLKDRTTVHANMFPVSADIPQKMERLRQQQSLAVS